jgi:hypothetical protein
VSVFIRGQCIKFGLAKGCIPDHRVLLALEMLAAFVVHFLLPGWGLSL